MKKTGLDLKIECNYLAFVYIDIFIIYYLLFTNKNKQKQYIHEMTNQMVLAFSTTRKNNSCNCCIFEPIHESSGM